MAKLSSQHSAYGGKIAALEPKNLTRLFLTHLHFVHTEGLSEFMLAPWIYYREGPLQLYGPPGTEDVVRHLTEAYTKDIDLQMFGLEHLDATVADVSTRAKSSNFVVGDARDMVVLRALSGIVMTYGGL